MNNEEPIIRPLPAKEKYIEFADALVTDEHGYNDEMARAYINTVLTVANPEDDFSWELANAGARHVFTKTEAFEKAFRQFAGYPDRPMYSADKYTIHAGTQEM